MPGRNAKIPDLLREVVTDINSAKTLAFNYKKIFGKDIMTDLISLSSSYDTINFYVEPFIESGFCEKLHPYRIIA